MDTEMNVLNLNERVIGSHETWYAVLYRKRKKTP